MKKDALLKDTETILDYLFFLLPEKKEKEIDQLICEDAELTELFTGLSSHIINSGDDREAIRNELKRSKARIASLNPLLK